MIKLSVLSGRENISITKSKMGDILPDERENPLKYKICVLGGAEVGKSCLTFQLLFYQFLARYSPTIKDAYMKEDFHVDGEAYTVEIMDTAGAVSYLYFLSASRTLQSIDKEFNTRCN